LQFAKIATYIFVFAYICKYSVFLRPSVYKIQCNFESGSVKFSVILKTNLATLPTTHHSIQTLYNAAISLLSSCLFQIFFASENAIHEFYCLFSLGRYFVPASKFLVPKLTFIGFVGMKRNLRKRTILRV